MTGWIPLLQEQVGPVDPDPAPPPLPGGAAEVVRFFMDVPQWIQIGGIIVGGIAGIIAVVLLWVRRREIARWIADLPPVVKAVTAAVVVAGGAVASVGGYQVYDFVEHDNQFCTGCHVMADAYHRFEESPHASLGCKDCHAQPRTESARQLYLWVLDRPTEVGPHSPVPDARCTSCHVDGDPEHWPQIAASLGHRIHFESDDPELGELMCVACHGVEVHEFTPASATCGDCHEAESEIHLGRMAAETELHCVACHDFLGDEPATLEGIPEGMALLPSRAQCQACHEMEAILGQEELEGDPHGAVCGACHNPHTQDSPEAAVETCQGCHEGSDTLTIFHTGTHAPIHAECAACHEAHTWRVQGSDCLSCHESVLGPAAAATRPWGPLAVHGAGSLTPPFAGWAPADTLPRPFLHREHEAVSCTECHGTDVEHGVMTVRTARDCAQCHHDPGRGYECAECHSPERIYGERPVDARMTFTVRDEPAFRELPFNHERHEDLSCQECHTGPVMMAVELECASCHDDHHRPEAECSQCHLPADDAHGLDVHLTCYGSGCHASEVTRPEWTRNVCLTCHTDQRDHEPGLSCEGCHRVPAVGT